MRQSRTYGSVGAVGEQSPMATRPGSAQRRSREAPPWVQIHKTTSTLKGLHNMNEHLCCPFRVRETTQTVTQGGARLRLADPGLCCSTASR